MNYKEQNFQNVKDFLVKHFDANEANVAIQTAAIRSLFAAGDPNRDSYELEDGTKLNVRHNKNPDQNYYSAKHYNAGSNAFFYDDYENEEVAALEANLLDAMSRLAEKKGMGMNELQHLFPAVLRMLKCQSPWTK